MEMSVFAGAVLAAAHIHTEVPLELLPNGSALLRLEPLSFTLVELDP